jgi:hypothetical protein
MAFPIAPLYYNIPFVERTCLANRSSTVERHARGQFSHCYMLFLVSSDFRTA